MNYLGFVEKRDAVASVETPAGLVDIKCPGQADQAEQEIAVEQPEAGTGRETDEQEHEADRQPDVRDAGVEPIRDQHGHHPIPSNPL